MKFMAYNWNHYENPLPKRRPRTAAGRENPQSKSANVLWLLVLVLVLLSSPHGGAGSAGNNLFVKIAAQKRAKIFSDVRKAENEDGKRK